MQLQGASDRCKFIAYLGEAVLQVAIALAAARVILSNFASWVN